MIGSRISVIHLVVVIVTAVFISGCGQGETTDVPAVTVASVTLEDVPDQLRIGHDVQLSAKALGADGSHITDIPITWLTSDEKVLSLTGATAKALEVGKATIIAKCADITESAEIRVVHPLVGWWQQAEKPEKRTIEIRHIGDSVNLEGVLQGYSLGAVIARSDHRYWDNPGGRTCIKSNKRLGMIFWREFTKISEMEWRATYDAPSYTVYRGGRRCGSQDPSHYQISIKMTDESRILVQNITKGFDPSPYARVTPDAAKATLRGETQHRDSERGRVVVLHDFRSLKDDTASFSGKRIEIEALYTGRGLRRDVGSRASFYAFDVTALSVRFRVSIPDDMEVPNAERGDRVTVVFECGEGDLNRGNTAISIVRPE